MLSGLLLLIACGSSDEDGKRPQGSGAAAGDGTSGASGGKGNAGSAGRVTGGAAGTGAGADSGGSTSGGTSAGGSDSPGSSGEAGAGGQAGAGAEANGGSSGAGGTGMLADPTCDKPPIEADARRDFDIGVVEVSGSVLLNGAAMPDSPDVDSRGDVLFVETLSGKMYWFPVSATGDATFSGTIFAGSYDVEFLSTPDADLVSMPSDKRSRLESDFFVGEDAELTLDASTVIVDGTLSVDGASGPSPTLPGSVVFRDRATGAEYDLPASSAYAGQLFAGYYDVVFSAEDAQSTVLASNVEIDESASLDYDLPLATVTGTLTLNGAALPDSPELTSRGDIVFITPETGAEFAIPLGATGAGAYTGTIFRGTYNVEFRTSADSRLVGLPLDRSVPIALGLELGAEPVVDGELTLVTVDGTLTLDGAPIPDSPGTAGRGFIGFRDVQTDELYELFVGPTGAASYALELFASTYEVVFRTTPDDNVLVLPPERRVVVAERATIAGDVTLEHDLVLVTLSGSLLANAAALPDSPGVASRGSLVFRDQTSGEKYTLPISATGAATFTTELFAGTYGVTFDTTTEEGLVGLPVGTATRLERKVVIAETREFTFDLEPLDLSGVLTLSGGDLPSSPDITTRGNLIFRDRESGGGYAFSVGATGPGDYAGLIFPGAHRIQFWAENDEGLNGLPLEGVTGLGAGCFPARACEKQAGDLSGVWHVSLGALEMNASLTQDGTTLSGNFNGDYAGVFSFGRVEDGAVELIAPSYGACRPYRITATVLDGCTFVGSATCSGQAYATETFGTR